jgi:hypothetical protein
VAVGPTNFVFAVTNFAFQVQASTDLSQTNWLPVGPAVFQFTDPKAPTNWSFYRIITQPNQ